MSRKFIAAVLTAAITVTGFAATPARATDVETLARILGTAATVYIIGSALKDADDRDDRRVYVHQDRNRDHRTRNRYDRPRTEYHRYDRSRTDSHRYDRGRDGRGRDWGRRSNKLPAACLLRGKTRKGEFRRVLGARCVENRFRNAHRLPNACRVQMRTNLGVRVVYKADCLNRKGYRIGHR